MLPTPTGTVWVYHKAIDLRKSYRSLCATVEQELSRSAHDGSAYVFVNRRRTLAKVLWWDRTGWCLLLKRLSAGRYRVSGKEELRELQLSGTRIFFDGL